jgi:hypothetical protein
MKADFTTTMLHLVYLRVFIFLAFECLNQSLLDLVLYFGAWSNLSCGLYKSLTSCVSVCIILYRC